eukprot:scaffold158786_cov35-Tisochrysis_lutea.AAC.2
MKAFVMPEDTYILCDGGSKPPSAQRGHILHGTRSRSECIQRRIGDTPSVLSISMRNSVRGRGGSASRHLCARLTDRIEHLPRCCHRRPANGADRSTHTRGLRWVHHQLQSLGCRSTRPSRRHADRVRGIVCDSLGSARDGGNSLDGCFDS